MPRTVKSDESVSDWDTDSAIVFDPIKQKFLKDSVKRIKDESNREDYTEIRLPRFSNKLECFVMGEENGVDQKVSVGTVNLGKLPWTLNAKRRAGMVKVLYVKGKFQPPH